MLFEIWYDFAPRGLMWGLFYPLEWATPIILGSVLYWDNILRGWGVGGRVSEWDKTHQGEFSLGWFRVLFCYPAHYMSYTQPVSPHSCPSLTRMPDWLDAPPWAGSGNAGTDLPPAGLVLVHVRCVHLEVAGPRVGGQARGSRPERHLQALQVGYPASIHSVAFPGSIWSWFAHL